MLQNRLFVALASRSGFGAAISDAIARSSIVFCNSVSADRIVVLPQGCCMRNTMIFCSWRLKIVLEWLHPGCDSDLSADFRNFGASTFPFKIPFKNASKSSFFCFGVEIRFWSCNSCVEKFVCKRLPCVKALCASTVCKCSVSKRLLCVKACCV